MTRPIFSLALALSLVPGIAPAQETAAQPATRPGDAEGTLPASDGMAECAAILAVASSKSKNFVQRNALQSAAASWFAASGDLAISEGTPSEDANWEGKVANWAGQIGSMEALQRHGDWMAYCAEVGAQHGLDTGSFPQGAG